MRHFLKATESGKVYRKFLRGAVPSDATIARSASSSRCHYDFASKRHFVTVPCQNVSSGKLNLLKESGFLSPFLFSASFSSRSGSSERSDPFARRPTSKCDPYGQSGKPLTLDKALGLMRTVEPEWKLALRKDDRGDEPETVEADGKFSDGHDDDTFVPFAISRVFWHDDYMLGAKFSTHVAAVAQMNAQHFPHEVIMSRRLQSRTKSWKICTKIVCRTHVLQGLSHHDFYLATLIDIEAQRPEVRGLLAPDGSQ
jgi:pterin-4a-carbinolamine dehydratase